MLKQVQHDNLDFFDKVVYINKINKGKIMSEIVDRLGREKEINAFSSIILNEDSKVISINSSWGTGKSTFIDLLIQKIEKENKALCIKYDSWESDYFDNPLIPLLYQITSHPKLNKRKSLKTESTKFSRQYAFGMSAGLNFGVSGEVNFNGGLSSEDINLLENYELTKKAVESFKKILKVEQERIKQPIIIFIDELDRCRPNYAIETLEIIKHFFNIDNITFVIAVDKEQLNNSIKALYGVDAETDGFLRKFIDIEMYLPDPKMEAWVKYLFSEEKYDILSRLNEFKTYLNPQTTTISNCINLANTLDFSLRDIDKLVLRLSLILNTFDSKKDTICINYLFLLLFFQQKFNNI